MPIALSAAGPSPRASALAGSPIKAERWLASMPGQGSVMLLL